MKIKECENLTKLARVAGKKVSDLSYEIYDELVDCGLIEKDDDVWGLLMSEALPDDKGVIYTMEAMERLGIKPSQDNVVAFLNLVIILDGDCPECGYDMDVFDGEYKYTGDGYNDPIESTPIWEDKKCGHCGHFERG